MKQIDLDALDAQHTREEAEEAGRSLLDHPRPRRAMFPLGGELPASSYWLERLYANERFAREKKPVVFDHLRSSGPWMVSVDEEPLCVMDGMSQTATVCDGFAEDPVVKAYVEGGFADTVLVCGDTTLADDPAELEFEARLMRQLPEFPHVAFTNSGAEAVEKALALCRIEMAERRPGATRILAFEGGFHGRTLLTLHATWNITKRGPFEMDGHTAAFAPFPVWRTPNQPAPMQPEGFIEAMVSGHIEELIERHAQADELLGRELASLALVDQQLASGEFYAVIVEPMQSEGGDRYATGRFFRGLRLVTRRHGVPLVFDEVQSGFGLGGTFVWHRRFGLVDAAGQPDAPDAVTFAKRAQSGVVVSRFEDPEPTHVHTASLVRGRIHAEMMQSHQAADRIHKMVQPRLARIATAYPHLVHYPRSSGYAFAFDLPSPETLLAYLHQRFWRGAVVFGAGDRTARYRLSDCWDEREIDGLFQTIRRSLSWLDAHPGKQPPAWEDFPDQAPRPSRPATYRIRRLTIEDADDFMPWVMEVEAATYEPARRDSPEKLRRAFEHPAGLAMVAEVDTDDGPRPIGSALGVPLELCTNIDGPKQDLMLGRHNTLYSLAISVSSEYQDRGVGRALKAAQIEAAGAIRRPDGTPRYRFVTGRNRVGHTPSMRHLNRSLGAHPVDIFHGAYDSPEGIALYYRIPVGPLAPGLQISSDDPVTGLDLASSLTAPLSAPPASLVAAVASGLAAGPAVTKVTLCNYITPIAVRAIEWVTALTPHHPHLVLANGRDETVDLAIRTLRWHRKLGRVVLGTRCGYVGHTTAAARSISDPGTHRQGPAVFDWPRVPHPAVVGTEATLAALDAEVERAGGAERVLGFFIEAIQERTGHVAPEGFWTALSAWRARTGVPVVLVETASGTYRSGQGAFLHPSLPMQPDVVTWFGGGQVGFVHVQTPWFVSTPMTMVSTWAGDELSLLRVHHQLRAARAIDIGQATSWLDEALTPLAEAGMELRGLGLYRMVVAGPRTRQLVDALRHRGTRVRAYPGGHVAITPSLDWTEADAQTLRRNLTDVLYTLEHGGRL